MKIGKQAGISAFLVVFAEYITIIKFFVRALNGGALALTIFYLVRHLGRIFQSRLFWLPVLYYMYNMGWQILNPSPYSYGFAKDIYLIVAGFMRFFCPIGIFLALMYNGDYRAFRKFMYCACAFLLVMSFFTIRADVGTARIAGFDAVNRLDNAYDSVEAVMTGCWGYGVIHQLPFVMYGAFVCAREIPDKKFRIASVCFGLVMFVAIYRSGFGTATLLSLVLMAFLLCRAKNAVPMFFAIAFFFVVFRLLWNYGVIANALSWVGSQFMETNVITTKIDEIVEASRGNVMGDADARVQLYALSWKGFCEHPFFGGGWEGKSGGHAFVLDVLARQGLVGFIMFAVCYLGTFFSLKKLFPKVLQIAFSLAMLVSVGMLSIKNLSAYSHPISLFFLMPSFFALKKEYYAEICFKVRRYFNAPMKEIRF